jgi:tetratricopeptide (TPR) repeat protein
LEKAAHAGDLLDLNFCAKTIHRHRIAAVAACVIWTLTLMGTLVAALLAPQLPFLAAPLWILVLTPSALLALAQRRQISLERRRMGHSRIRTALFVVALLACLVLGYFPDVVESLFAPVAWLEDSQYFLLYPLLLAGFSLPAAFWMRRLQETRKVRGEVAIAFQVQDFCRVLEIARSSPAVVRRDPLLRYNLAFARAICGDRDGAIAEFEKLWCDKPAFAISAITLSVLLLDDDQVERALKAANQVALRLPGDPATHVLVARSLRRLGRLNDAQTACERALALDPGEGKAHAVAAAVALDDGEFFRAQQSIATSLELSPGDPYALLVRAEVVLKTQPFEDPHLAVEEALAAVRSNAFAFYHADVIRLEQALAEWERTSLVLETADPVA